MSVRPPYSTTALVTLGGFNVDLWVLGALAFVVLVLLYLLLRWWRRPPRRREDDARRMDEEFPRPPMPPETRG